MTAHRGPGSLGDDLLSAALAHARCGWHVFPLRPGGKRPALHGEGRCPRTGPCHDGHLGWEQRATTDPARIHACWTHGPCFNIGIACGPSELVVIDLDTPKTGAAPPAQSAPPGIRDGVIVLTELYQRHGQPWPPATFTVATPSGRHLYFTAPPGLRLGNTAGRLGRCIDTRAAGGYAVAPGSIVAGRTYVAINPADPVPLPWWLAAQLADQVIPPAVRPPGTPAASAVAHPDRYARAALDSEIRRVASAPVGRRNDTLNRAAFNLGQLIAAGLLPASLACTALTGAARRAGLDRDPGCGPRGIGATIRSGLAAGARNPRASAACLKTPRSRMADGGSDVAQRPHSDSGVSLGACAAG
jgi:Bifunctional DNA primase/polymerase, N-terminal